MPIGQSGDFKGTEFGTKVAAVRRCLPEQWFDSKAITCKCQPLLLRLPGSHCKDAIEPPPQLTPPLAQALQYDLSIAVGAKATAELL